MGNPIIEIAVSQGDRTLGSIRLELYPDKAPGTVQNFLSLVDAGFYTGLIFHRVIRGFMIQGGGFTPDFTQKRAKAIRGEFIANGYMGNDIRHTRGVISMARTSDPDSASSQFFIMQEDAPHWTPSMPPSARSRKAWRSWTRSRPAKPDGTADTRMCRVSRLSSPR